MCIVDSWCKIWLGWCVLESYRNVRSTSIIFDLILTLTFKMVSSSWMIKASHWYCSQMGGGRLNQNFVWRANSKSRMDFRLTPLLDLSNSVWITEIGQGVFKLCEHEESRPVGRSVRYIQTRASTGLVVNHCTVVMSPNGNSRDTWHATPQKIPLSPTVLELGAEMCSNGRQKITTP